MDKKFDAIIIGSGQGGTPLAKKLANSGWKTALIERTHVGGTSVNTGCTPTKTMIASAKAAYVAKTAKEKGVVVNHVSIDLPAIIARKNTLFPDKGNDYCPSVIRRIAKQFISVAR